MKAKNRLFSALICAVMLICVVATYVSALNIEVSVSLPEGSEAILNPDATVTAEEIDYDLSAKALEDIKLVCGDNAEMLASYKIYMLLEGHKVQPGGEVKITIPAPENTGNYTSIKVFYVDDGGNAIPCNTLINSDGTLTFTADRFTDFLIIGTAEEETNPIIVIVIGVVLAITAILMFLRRRNDDKNAPQPEAAPMTDEVDEYEDAEDSEEYDEYDDSEEEDKDTEDYTE